VRCSFPGWDSTEYAFQIQLEDTSFVSLLNVFHLYAKFPSALNWTAVFNGHNLIIRNGIPSVGQEGADLNIGGGLCVIGVKFDAATAQARDRHIGRLRPPLVPSIAIV
jgi:hypothetical protein